LHWLITLYDKVSLKKEEEEEEEEHLKE